MSGQCTAELFLWVIKAAARRAAARPSHRPPSGRAAWAPVPNGGENRPARRTVRTPYPTCPPHLGRAAAHKVASASYQRRSLRFRLAAYRRHGLRSLTMFGPRIFLILGSLALLIGGCQAAGSAARYAPGRPIVFALVGIGLMLGALAMAIIEQQEKKQEPPAGALRLQDDRQEQEPGS